MPDPQPPPQIINTWDQLRAAVAQGVIPREKAVTVGWSWSQGRGHYRDGAQVWSPFFDVGDRKTAHWSDTVSGQKVPKHFWASRRSLDGALEEALDWAIREYGLKGMTKNRIGDWVPLEVQKQLPIPKEPKP